MQLRSKFTRPDSEQQKQKNQALYTKYTALGKEALAQGDRIEAERNFQYAEHYIRLINFAHESSSQKQNTQDMQNVEEKNSQDTPIDSFSDDLKTQKIEETFPLPEQVLVPKTEKKKEKFNKKKLENEEIVSLTVKKKKKPRKKIEEEMLPDLEEKS